MIERMRNRLAVLRARIPAQFRPHGDTGRPSQAHICPTDRCNLQCHQCDIWRKPTGGELPTEAWQRVLRELADLSPGMSVNFSGGEPFLRRDMLELIACATGLGLTVSANTNGLLMNATMARRLFDAGLDILYVSLDGATPASHDAIRNKPGLFHKVMEALDALATVPKPRVVLATILHAGSLDEVGDLLQLCRDRGLQIVFQPIYQPFGQPFNPNWYRDNPWLPRDMNAVDRALDQLVDARRRGGPVCNEAAQLEAFKGYFRAPTQPNGLSCRAGFTDVSFDARGHLLACYHLAPIGNVRSAGVAELWWSAEAARRRQEVAGCRRTCNLQNCNFDGFSV